MHTLVDHRPSLDRGYELLTSVLALVHVAPFRSFGYWGPVSRSWTSRPCLLTCPVHRAPLDRCFTQARGRWQFLSQTKCIMIISSRSVAGSFLSTSYSPVALNCIPARSSVVLDACQLVIRGWSPPVASSRSVPDLLLSTDFLLVYVNFQRCTSTCFPDFFSYMTSAGAQQPITLITISTSVSSASVI